MMNLQVNLNNAVDMMIDSKLESEINSLNLKIAEIEQKIVTATNPMNEILQQKEVLELFGIGRKRLKNWVGRGLNEIRVDNRVYYRYTDLMNFIENGQ